MTDPIAEPEGGSTAEVLGADELDEVNGAGLEITGIKLPDPNRPKTEQETVEALRREMLRRY